MAYVNFLATNTTALPHFNAKERQCCAQLFNLIESHFHPKEETTNPLKQYFLVITCFHPKFLSREAKIWALQAAQKNTYFCEDDNTGPSMQATNTCIIHFRGTTHCAYCVGLNVLEESDVRT